MAVLQAAARSACKVLHCALGDDYASRSEAQALLAVLLPEAHPNQLLACGSEPTGDLGQHFKLQLDSAISRISWLAGWRGLASLPPPHLEAFAIGAFRPDSSENDFDDLRQRTAQRLEAVGKVVQEGVSQYGVLVQECVLARPPEQHTWLRFTEAAQAALAIAGLPDQERNPLSEGPTVFECWDALQGPGLSPQSFNHPTGGQIERRWLPAVWVARMAQQWCALRALELLAEDAQSPSTYEQISKEYSELDKLLVRVEAAMQGASSSASPYSGGDASTGPSGHCSSLVRIRALTLHARHERLSALLMQAMLMPPPPSPLPPSQQQQQQSAASQQAPQQVVALADIYRTIFGLEGLGAAAGGGKHSSSSTGVQLHPGLHEALKECRRAIRELEASSGRSGSGRSGSGVGQGSTAAAFGHQRLSWALTYSSNVFWTVNSQPRSRAESISGTDMAALMKPLDLGVRDMMAQRAFPEEATTCLDSVMVVVLALGAEQHRLGQQQATVTSARANTRSVPVDQQRKRTMAAGGANAGSTSAPGAAQWALGDHTGGAGCSLHLGNVIMQTVRHAHLDMQLAQNVLARLQTILRDANTPRVAKEEPALTEVSTMLQGALSGADLRSAFSLIVDKIAGIDASLIDNLFQWQALHGVQAAQQGLRSELSRLQQGPQEQRQAAVLGEALAGENDRRLLNAAKRYVDAVCAPASMDAMHPLQYDMALMLQAVAVIVAFGEPGDVPENLGWLPRSSVMLALQHSAWFRACYRLPAALQLGTGTHSRAWGLWGAHDKEYREAVQPGPAGAEAIMVLAAAEKLCCGAAADQSGDAVSVTRTLLASLPHLCVESSIPSVLAACATEPHTAALVRSILPHKAPQQRQKQAQPLSATAALLGQRFLGVAAVRLANAAAAVAIAACYQSTCSVLAHTRLIEAAAEGSTSMVMQRCAAEAFVKTWIPTLQEYAQAQVRQGPTGSTSPQLPDPAGLKTALLLAPWVWSTLESSLAADEKILAPLLRLRAFGGSWASAVDATLNVLIIQASPKASLMAAAALEPSWILSRVPSWSDEGVVLEASAWQSLMGPAAPSGSPAEYDSDLQLLEGLLAGAAARRKPAQAPATSALQMPPFMLTIPAGVQDLFARAQSLAASRPELVHILLQVTTSPGATWRPGLAAALLWATSHNKTLAAGTTIGQTAMAAANTAACMPDGALLLAIALHCTVREGQALPVASWSKAIKCAMQTAPGSSPIVLPDQLLAAITSAITPPSPLSASKPVPKAVITRACMRNLIALAEALVEVRQWAVAWQALDCMTRLPAMAGRRPSALPVPVAASATRLLASCVNAGRWQLALMCMDMLTSGDNLLQAHLPWSKVVLPNKLQRKLALHLAQHVPGREREALQLTWHNDVEVLMVLLARAEAREGEGLPQDVLEVVLARFLGIDVDAQADCTLSPVVGWAARIALRKFASSSSSVVVASSEGIAAAVGGWGSHSLLTLLAHELKVTETWQGSSDREGADRSSKDDLQALCRAVLGRLILAATSGESAAVTTTTVTATSSTAMQLAVPPPQPEDVAVVEALCRRLVEGEAVLGGSVAMLLYAARQCIQLEKAQPTNSTSTPARQKLQDVFVSAAARLVSPPSEPGTAASAPVPVVALLDSSEHAAVREFVGIMGEARQWKAVLVGLRVLGGSAAAAAAALSASADRGAGMALLPAEAAAYIIGRALQEPEEGSQELVTDVMLAALDLAGIVSREGAAAAVAVANRLAPAERTALSLRLQALPGRACQALQLCGSDPAVVAALLIRAEEATSSRSSVGPSTSPLLPNVLEVVTDTLFPASNSAPLIVPVSPLASWAARVALRATFMGGALQLQGVTSSTPSTAVPTTNVMSALAEGMHVLPGDDVTSPAGASNRHQHQQLQLQRCRAVLGRIVASLGPTEAVVPSQRGSRAGSVRQQVMVPQLHSNDPVMAKAACAALLHSVPALAGSLPLLLWAVLQCVQPGRAQVAGELAQLFMEAAGTVVAAAQERDAAEPNVQADMADLEQLAVGLANAGHVQATYLALKSLAGSMHTQQPAAAGQVETAVATHAPLSGKGAASIVTAMMRTRADGRSVALDSPAGRAALAALEVAGGAGSIRSHMEWGTRSQLAQLLAASKQPYMVMTALKLAASSPEVRAVVLQLLEGSIPLDVGGKQQAHGQHGQHAGTMMDHAMQRDVLGKVSVAAGAGRKDTPEADRVAALCMCAASADILRVSVAATEELQAGLMEGCTKPGSGQAALQALRSLLHLQQGDAASSAKDVIALAFAAIRHSTKADVGAGDSHQVVEAAIAACRIAFQPAVDGTLTAAESWQLARWALLCCCPLLPWVSPLLPLLQVPLERELAAAEAALAGSGNGCNASSGTTQQHSNKSDSDYVGALAQAQAFMALLEDLTAALPRLASILPVLEVAKPGKGKAGGAAAAAPLVTPQTITEDLEACRLPLTDVLVAGMCAYASRAWPMWLSRPYSPTPGAKVITTLHTLPALVAAAQACAAQQHHALVVDMFKQLRLINPSGYVPPSLLLVTLQAALMLHEGIDAAKTYNGRPAVSSKFVADLANELGGKLRMGPGGAAALPAPFGALCFSAGSPSGPAQPPSDSTRKGPVAEGGTKADAAAKPSAMNRDGTACTASSGDASAVLLALPAPVAETFIALAVWRAVQAGTGVSSDNANALWRAVHEYACRTMKASSSRTPGICSGNGSMSSSSSSSSGSDQEQQVPEVAVADGGIAGTAAAPPRLSAFGIHAVVRACVLVTLVHGGGMATTTAGSAWQEQSRQAARLCSTARSSLLRYIQAHGLVMHAATYCAIMRVNVAIHGNLKRSLTLPLRLAAGHLHTPLPANMAGTQSGLEAVYNAAIEAAEWLAAQIKQGGLCDSPDAATAAAAAYCIASPPGMLEDSFLELFDADVPPKVPLPWLAEALGAVRQLFDSSRKACTGGDSSSAEHGSDGTLGCGDGQVKASESAAQWRRWHEEAAIVMGPLEGSSLQGLLDKVYRVQ